MSSKAVHYSSAHSPSIIMMLWGRKMSLSLSSTLFIHSSTISVRNFFSSLIETKWTNIHMQSSSSYPFATQKGYTTAAVSRVSLFAFFGNNHRTLHESVRVLLESELLEAAIASHLETSSHRKQPWDKSDTNPKIPQHLNMHKQMSPEKKLSRSLIGRMFSAQKNSLRQHISVREKILFWFPQKYFQSFFFSSRREMARI